MPVYEITRPSKGYILCPDCGKEFKSLGYPRHRRMHDEELKKLKETK